MRERSSAREPIAIAALLLLRGGEQLGKFFDGRGEVGVGKQNPIPFGFEHSMPDSVALAAIARIADQTQARFLRRPPFHHRRGGVGRAVVHHQHLGIPVWGGVQPSQNYIEGRGETALFVIRGDDDGERQRSIIAADPPLALRL